ncbi:MAG: phosphatase PAP2 family protein [Bacteroidales bacterium]|nr:phosphatase PAP2 family protein [Bacteroidales bacterium]
MKHRFTGWFLVPSLLVLLITCIISIAFPRELIHMEINRWHTPFLDQLFKLWTLLGDGWVVLILVLIPLTIKIRYSLVLFSGYIISGLSAQLIKRLFFGGAARPAKYFELYGIDYDLYLVPGVDLHTWYSFPSGHTATAFGVFCGLSLILRSGWGQLMAFIMAAGVAYSRMYLSQHFLMDVTAGAIVGLVGGYIGWWWINRYEKDWLNLSLPKLLIR